MRENSEPSMGIMTRKIKVDKLRIVSKTKDHTNKVLCKKNEKNRMSFSYKKKEVSQRSPPSFSYLSQTVLRYSRINITKRIKPEKIKGV